MAQGKRPPKNPYCKRSKFTKKQFEDLLFYYFAEVIEEKSRDQIRYLFTMTSWLKEEDKTKHPPTRQAIGRNFDRISQYIWYNCIVDDYPLLKEKTVFDELLDLIYGKIDEASSPYKEIYNDLGDIPTNPNEDKLTNSLIFYLLSSRSKAIKGFNRDKFYLEFSRMFFICLVIHVNKIEIPSIYAAHALPYPIEKIRNAEWYKNSDRTIRNRTEWNDIDEKHKQTNRERTNLINYSKHTLIQLLGQKIM